MADPKSKAEQEESEQAADVVEKLEQAADVAEELEQAAQVDKFLKKWCAKQEELMKMEDAVAVSASQTNQIPQTSEVESQGPSGTSDDWTDDEKEHSGTDETTKTDEQQEQQQKQEKQKKHEEPYQQEEQEQQKKQKKQKKHEEPYQQEEEWQQIAVDEYFESLTYVHRQVTKLYKVIFPPSLFPQAYELHNPDANSGPSSASDGYNIDARLSPTDQYLTKLCTIQQEIAKMQEVIDLVNREPSMFLPEIPEPAPGSSSASDDPNKKDDTNTEGKGDGDNPISAKELKRRKMIQRRMKKLKQVENGIKEMAEGIDAIYEMIDREKQLKKLEKFQKDLDEDRHLR